MASLHSTLSSIDGSQPSIHAAAAAMMRHYDKSPGVAVNEWRNCLYATKSSSKLLPLLYICNEVLQNSKRNRGTKFLEAFSPVLGQALQYVCQQDASIVEKVRRTAKIWGDRAVYSPRFIAELLAGLEPFRHGQQQPPPMPEGAFSPQQGLFSPEKSEEAPINNVTPSSPSIDHLLAPDNPSFHSDDDDDDDEDDNDDGYNNNDDDDVLGDSSTSFLQVTIDATRVVQDHAAPKRKRRHHQTKKMATKKRRKSVLSTTSLMDLWNQVTSLQQSFETSQTITAGIHDDHLTTHGTDQLVGDDLLEAFNKVREYETLVQNEQVQLHKIAQGKRAVEREAIRYIHWCRSALLQDAEDLDVCNKLEEELKQLIPFHAKAKLAREERRAQEAIAAVKAKEERQRLQELEERKKLLEAAMKKQDVAEEGMVWNPTTQEYQYLNTNEDWRN